MNTDEEQPFVRVSPPPPRPPNVMLARKDAGVWLTVQTGTLYNGEWARNAYRSERVGRFRETDPVPWPQPAEITGRPGLGVILPVPAVPRMITVSVFDDAFKVDGTPSSSPFLELECWMDQFRRGEPPCSLEAGEGGYTLALPGLRFNVPLRLAVNVSWAVPPPISGGGIDTSWATWLFAAQPMD